MKKSRTTDSVADALPGLLEERQLSLRQLAQTAGVDVGHLSRIVGGRKPASGALAMSLAQALGLPDAYFPEAREHVVIDAIRSDPALRDRLYKRLRG